MAVGVSKGYIDFYSFVLGVLPNQGFLDCEITTQFDMSMDQSSLIDANIEFVDTSIKINDLTMISTDFNFTNNNLCFQTNSPTLSPTLNPTLEPTNSTSNPTLDPTLDPTVDPTTDPTLDPTIDPTNDPTVDPTVNPTIDPTNDPTIDPTVDPTIDPTVDPTLDPTNDPTLDPTLDPTNDPTLDPTLDPTKELQGNNLHDILKNAVFFLTLNSIKWHNGEFSINQSFKLMNYDS